MLTAEPVKSVTRRPVQQDVAPVGEDHLLPWADPYIISLEEHNRQEILARKRRQQPPHAPSFRPARNEAPFPLGETILPFVESDRGTSLPQTSTPIRTNR